MATKDHNKFYSGLNSSGNPNQVSRNLKTGDRAFSQVVYQSGKPILDSELNLSEDISSYVRKLVGRNQTQSGFLRGLTFKDSYGDYSFTAPASVLGTYTNNRFHMKKVTAMVAGEPIVVEYVNTDTASDNVIILNAPQVYDGTNTTIKRTDLVFLEVWKTLVAPSVKASTTLVIDTSVDALTTGADSITVSGNVFSCVGVGLGYPSVPAGTDWEIGGTDIQTANNIANAINNASIGITADNNGTNIDTLKVDLAGTSGNATAISVVSTNALALVLSGVFTGGEDRLNKPAQNKIYRHGNVQSLTASWLDDDLVDPNIDTESTQRIQVQYRIRVTDHNQGVNHKQHPDGFTTPRNIVGADGQINAQGSKSSAVDFYPFVPCDSVSARDNSSAVSYGITDSGLFIAGDGSEISAQALGTIDGYVYAIPISFVFRKNNASDTLSVKGFDPINNTNGAPMSNHTGYVGVIGAIGTEKSDRPDKAFCDVISMTDILDLRRSISFEGVDLKSELQYQMQSLLDGNFKTWAVDSASKQTLGGSSGDVSTQFLVCNEFGRENSKGGIAPFSGDTNRGTTERSFDHLARRFGDQPVVERVVLAFYPGDRDTTTAPAIGSGQVNDGKYVTKTGASTDRWCDGDQLHIDLSSFDSSSNGFVFDGNAWVSSAGGIGDPSASQFAPSGMVITDVISIRHDDGHYATPTIQDVQATTIFGLGTTHLEIHLDKNDQLVSGGLAVDGANPEYKMISDSVITDGSPRRIFVEVEVSYPLGVGLSDTPDVQLSPDPVVYPYGEIIECGGVRPNDMENPLKPVFRTGYREVALEYIASENGGGAPIGSITSESIVSSSRNTLNFPRRVYKDKYQDLTVSDLEITTAMGIDYGNCAFGSSEREVVLTGNLSGNGHSLCEVTYYAQDPIPNYGASGGGYQIAVYYRTNAPQTCGVKEGDINGPAGGGLLPTTLVVEPLIADTNLWTGQVGMGAVESAFPYVAPLDQITVNDGSSLDVPTMTGGATKEWYFCATSTVEINDFNSNTGLLALHSFVQADRTEFLTIGGSTNDQKPRKDLEFRAYYPFVDDTVYRPTIISQKLSGAVRHKVFVPMLARATEDAKGLGGGILYRKNEVLLLVFSRFAQLDNENNVQFLDTDNRTSVAVYRTKNLLLLVGE